MAKSKRSLGAQRSTASLALVYAQVTTLTYPKTSATAARLEGQEGAVRRRPFFETSGPSWWLNQPIWNIWPSGKLLVILAGISPMLRKYIDSIRVHFSASYVIPFRVKLDHFSKDQGENEKYLKPPPRNLRLNSEKTDKLGERMTKTRILSPFLWVENKHYYGRSDPCTGRFHSSNETRETEENLTMPKTHTLRSILNSRIIFPGTSRTPRCENKSFTSHTHLSSHFRSNLTITFVQPFKKSNPSSCSSPGS